MDLQQNNIDESTNAIINARTSYNPFQVVRNAEAVTPSDTVDLTNYGVILVTVGGDVKVDLIVQFGHNEMMPSYWFLSQQSF